MSCLARHAQTLRARGYRVTSQRLAVLQALHEGGHLSPGQIYARVRSSGMTEATVYRTLEFLCRNGITFAAQKEGGHLTYELAASSHHHLVCRVCGAQIDLDPAPVQGFLSRLEQQSGYQLEASHLTFFGLCPACQTHSP